MGFTASIMAQKRNKLPIPNCSAKEFAEEHDNWFKTNNWNYDNLCIESWCSSGNLWFKHLDQYIDPVEEGFYVITSNNYPKLVEYANILMDKIQLKPYNIRHSLSYVDKDDYDAGYLCKPIDGINVGDNEGNIEEIWCDCDLTESDFLGILNKDFSEYYSIFLFIKAVMKIGLLLNNDDCIVWISGGW